MSLKDPQRYPPKSDLSRYYEAVGRVSNAWAFLDMNVNHSIWRLVGAEQKACACVTAQIIAPMAKFRALAALAKFRGAPDKRASKIDKMSGSADKLARQRNRYVHDPAAVKGEEIYRLIITADRSLDFGMTQFDFSEIQQLEIEIKDLTRRFKELMDKLFSELPPYDDGSFQQGEGIALTLPQGPNS